MIDQYEYLQRDKNKQYILIKCPQLNTQALNKRGVQLNGEIQYLKNMISFASQIKYYEILRPKDMFSVDEQINKLKEIVV